MSYKYSPCIVLIQHGGEDRYIDVDNGSDPDVNWSYVTAHVFANVADAAEAITCLKLDRWRPWPWPATGAQVIELLELANLQTSVAALQEDLALANIRLQNALDRIRRLKGEDIRD